MVVKALGGCLDVVAVKLGVDPIPMVREAESLVATGVKWLGGFLELNEVQTKEQSSFAGCVK